MAAEVTGSFEYRITHSISRESGNRPSRTICLSNAMTGCLERFDKRVNETVETCDHCGARLLVALPSFAEVRRQQRVHGVLWKVYALATILCGYGFLQVIHMTGKGSGPLFAFCVTVCATLFFAYLTLLSGLGSVTMGGPDVTRVDNRDHGDISHRWSWVTGADDS
ncbi:hypothetical protein [Streptomyces sp. SID12501]|uniref:Uncharacterized protein n=1 Tax=Streptomyces sp. SID12501 TaxID=2706042 RepID=A0A6B3C6R5_9ACTN|nr:hypothetical protein [Streptomyces sp. SID12501]NEC92012.1 hypothetical protein [Streptomyces sp. SID12501]